MQGEFLGQPLPRGNLGGGYGLASMVTLTLPKLSAYSRYSEDICTEGWGVEGPCSPDMVSPRTLKLPVLLPTKGSGMRGSLPPSRVLSPGTSEIPALPPQDSRGCCDVPWSPAACGRRGPWWTRPGCACTPWRHKWGRGSLLGTLARLRLQLIPPKGNPAVATPPWPSSRPCCAEQVSPPVSHRRTPGRGWGGVGTATVLLSAKEMTGGGEQLQTPSLWCWGAPRQAGSPGPCVPPSELRSCPPEQSLPREPLAMLAF